MFDLTLDDACRPSPILFENADWRVAADGLEHRETGYFIAREAIGIRRDNLWEWPLHLAEKNWCTVRLFREAFLAAIDAFGVARDADLAQSFAVAFGFVASGASQKSEEDFVSLGDLVRPKSTVTGTSRKRNPASEGRVIARRMGSPASQRIGETSRHRIAL
ncbi:MULTISPECIES: hypothetical protein [unclassified Methylobacterium]|uniref:hypothetical protein n=1 Tax=unclassified Methylobacterium TaxID=2615210 RepID=UPI0006F81E57|nr:MULTISPECIES: hypothetical protein [unclassified Methylobacterium]KQP91725.1 hypothetical protein ASF57_04165 [Methylobacterium sp. Leaf117]MCK2052695.1 hypothetical protein [Methylobacterium sp. 37f]